MLPRYRKIKSLSSQLFSRSTSYHSKKLDLEAGRVYFGVPIFSYSELEEATNNFANDKLLGDGGFGTVYHGKKIEYLFCWMETQYGIRKFEGISEKSENETKWRGYCE